MTLVEHFIEINGWSSSRKTALLMGLGFVVQGVASLVAHFAGASAQIVNMQMLDALLVTWQTVVAFCFLVSLAAAWAGKEARWVVYMMVFLYGGCVVTLIYLLGIWSTPALSWIPMVVIMMSLYYDLKLGWFSAICSVLFLGVAGGLQSAGILPYAPMLLARTVDAQHGYQWFTGVIYAGVINPFAFVFVLSILVVSARKLQDSRLQEAHKLLERSNLLIRRYVPAQVVDAIMEGRDEAADIHTRSKLTLFFSDLVGFTDIAEQMEPEDLSRVLNEYFSEMTAIAQRYDGTVDELSGDAISYERPRSCAARGTHGSRDAVCGRKAQCQMAG